MANSGLFTVADFKNRGVIKLAPDALVYIGGSLEMTVIAPVASNGGQLSFSDGISSISVQNNVDPPGSSTATIEVVTPIYGEGSRYWVRFHGPEGGDIRLPIFVPMMEVKIFFKGRFMVDGAPKYYPAFWGMITGVEETYSGGMHKISIACCDILHWWSYVTVTVHPVPESDVASGGQKLTAFSTIFDEANPYTIMYSLFQGLGMHEMVAPTWLAQLTPLNTIYPPALFKKAMKGIMSYWQTRFANLANLFKMYGVLGEKVSVNKPGLAPLEGINPNYLRTSYVQNDISKQSSVAPKNTTGWKVNTDILKKFTPFFDYDNMGTFEHADVSMSKLDIATEIKTRCDFEFFQDTNGNFIFKPPFYNVDVRGLPSYEIENRDVINSSFNFDSEGVITALQVYTSFDPHLKGPNVPRGTGYHVDIDMANKYGFRFKELQITYLMNERLARQAAVATMNMINTKCNTGSVTIPGRPEMRLGYPIYVKYRDSFHYIKSINHTFDFGGTFTTTLGLEMERRKFYLMEDTGQWNQDKQHPLIYKFSEGANLDNPPPAPPAVRKSDQQTPVEAKQEQLARSQNQAASLRIGRYEIVHQEKEEQITITESTVPVTDEGGYRVIGGFPYGRLLNPRIIDDDSLTYNYNKDNFNVTSMSVGSLNEGTRMGLSFAVGKEGAVPRYLLSQVLKTTGKDLPQNSTVPNEPEVSQQTQAQKTTPPDQYSQMDPTTIEPSQLVNVAETPDYDTLMIKLNQEAASLKTTLQSQQDAALLAKQKAKK